MREYDIGDVLTTEQDRILGVLTDRDIVVRTLADEKDPARTTAGEIASGRLVTVASDDPASRAVPCCGYRSARTADQWASCRSATPPSSRIVTRRRPTSAPPRPPLTAAVSHRPCARARVAGRPGRGAR
jgi:hypothetical protein